MKKKSAAGSRTERSLRIPLTVCFDPQEYCRKPATVAEQENKTDFEHEDQAVFDAGPSSPLDSMREMIEYIARALASNPEAVSVTTESDEGQTYLRLSVDDQDKGKVIGRDGRVAQSMRSLLRVAATKADTRVNLEID